MLENLNDKSDGFHLAKATVKMNAKTRFLIGFNEPNSYLLRNELS